MSNVRRSVESLVPGDVVVDDAGGRHVVARVATGDQHTVVTLTSGDIVRVPARLRLRIVMMWAA
jgi:hypothetical protein